MKKKIIKILDRLLEIIIKSRLEWYSWYLNSYIPYHNKKVRELNR